MSKVCSINSVISKGSLIINEGGLISSRSVRSGSFVNTLTKAPLTQEKKISRNNSVTKQDN